MEPPEAGIMTDLLWADPIKENGRQPSKRGISMGFGPDVAEQFLKQNNLGIFLFIKKLVLIIVTITLK